MTQVYEALQGTEVAKLIVRAMASLVSNVPGLNSRLVTFPKVKITIDLTVESFESATIERTELFEYAERAIAEGEMQLAPGSRTEHFRSIIDETENPADELRRIIGVSGIQPRRTDQGFIVDADPLPAGENLANIVSADQESPLGPHGGRVIDQAPMTDRAKSGTLNEPTPKLKGEEGATHFRIRR